MKTVGVFPFGQPILPVNQKNRSTKRVFVLGVYASAVHARWVGPDGKVRISALGVASEPEIFWRGTNVEAILRRISIPREVGVLEPASENLNGPSGRALDEHFLSPLQLSRENTWLCDLFPYSCMNPRQEEAIKNKYLPLVDSFHLPRPDWRSVPEELASVKRRTDITAEFLESGASVIITLGDQPLRWFTKHFGSFARLASYGVTPAKYGRLHQINIGNREVSLLPLAHPRQAAGLGSHSSKWMMLHRKWTKTTAPTLLQ